MHYYLWTWFAQRGFIFFHVSKKAGGALFRTRESGAFKRKKWVQTEVHALESVEAI